MYLEGSTLMHDDILASFENPVLLKKGGQKVVYQAKDRVHGPVVVKIGNYSSDSTLERIKREVQLLKEIDSIYYPRNYDLIITKDNRFIIIEEFVEAQPLTAYLEKFDTPKSVMQFGYHLASGLKVLWDRPTAHRDIKPDNILLASSGYPKIIDLGIAKIPELDSLTGTYLMRGPCTPAYASPEQLKNRKAQIDYRTDQFSMGITLLQLLLKGKHPFHPALVGGTSIDSNILTNNWYRHALEQPALISLKSLITTLLEPEPFGRYKNTSALLNDFKNCIEVLP